MPLKSNKSRKLVLWFKELNRQDVKYVGGKNSSLGEMYRYLTPRGVLVPNGFAVTAAAYQHFLKDAGIKKAIATILKQTKISDITSLAKGGLAIRQTILKSEFPEDLKEEIIKSYRQLEKEFGPNCDVAVRSSATAEDLPDASFAGQQETFLNVRGTTELMLACRKCFASLFTNRAISYRADKHYDHFKISLSIGVQKMIRSDLATSGVMFSLDTESGFKDVVLINASYGLGENIVLGKVTPDEFFVYKPGLAKGNYPILSRRLGTKSVKLIYSGDAHNPTVDVPVPVKDRAKFCLTDRDVIKLAKWAVIIEKHYGRPMDMEWAKDGRTGQLYIVQGRPETVQSQRDYTVLEDYTLLGKGKVLITGSPVGSRIGAGVAHVLNEAKDISKFKKGEVLVTDMTDPDWEPIMKIASAIVTNRGGRTCHAAIISRELGIPCIVGTEHGTAKIKTGRPITVSCAEGEIGSVYDGQLKFKVTRTSIKNLKRPKTKIMMNLGDPDQAFSYSFVPNDGVGLAREEFIINSYIKIHPMALLHFHRLKDQKAKREIAKLTAAYPNKKQYYIDQLASGIAIIAAAFAPKDVIVRLSDFKSNEYANLIGGKEFEPVEDNPMIGWRGASRYYDPKYQPAFELECQALKKVRDLMGLKNVKIMVPFCRTVDEGKAVLKVMAANGLKRGVGGLQVYVMCEIPANVILADEFSKIFDGFSIGSNDLTQLTLGLDRDSELVSHIYDERNQAVKDLVSQVIVKAKRNKRHMGFCGQAPSDFPEFARYLVTEGIDSMSLNPDTVIRTTLDIIKLEKSLRRKKK
ncbi:MAG: phosphoenolpyruvate synthase [Patescibacteria group bacterium]|jgi:pyruvate,water dikinase